MELDGLRKTLAISQLQYKRTISVSSNMKIITTSYNGDTVAELYVLMLNVKKLHQHCAIFLLAIHYMS
jgi:hypothetical protein